MVDLTSLGIPPSFQEFPRKSPLFSMDKETNKNQVQIINQWVKQGEGSLILYGKPGRGKSYTAVTCMYYLGRFFEIPWHEMRFVNVPALYQEWLANMSDYSVNACKLKRMQEVKVLVLDDLGVRKPTESFLDYLHCLIDTRYDNENLITIYTTNLTAEEFNLMLGPRISSRTSGTSIFFDGPDYRRQKKQLQAPQPNKIEKLTQIMG